MYSYSSRTYRQANRFHVLFYVTLFFFAVITAKLVWLQIIYADEYQVLAEEQNSRGVVLPAKRGNIYAKDHRTNELFPLAQNSTTYTVFADPLLIDNGTEVSVAEKLIPLLYVELQAEPVEQDPNPDAEEDVGTERITTEVNSDPRAAFKNQLVEQLVTKDVVRRELHDISEEEIKIVSESHLPGVTLEDGIIVINPTLIENPDDTATKLATILEAKYDDIYPLMIRKKVRYIRLATRVAPDTKDEIEALGIRGVGAIPEYRRIYPEANLASQVVGFLDHDEHGVYGIEGAFDQVLRGQDGLRKTQVDPFNRQITVGDVTIENATDGSSVVLTVDRAIQKIVEEELAKVVDSQRADGGQAIVMDPDTGAILALAHYPTFDPNNYGAVYATEELSKKEEERKWVDEEGNVHTEQDVWWETTAGEKAVTEWGIEYVVRNGYRYPVFTEYRDGEEFRKLIYENRVGEGAFGLKAATDPYEPGSVFKSIVMASALDSGEVTPTTRSAYNGPVELDEINYLTKKPIVIKNSQNVYHGQETMTEVLANSSNIGMTFVAQQLGAATFYDYLRKFGFGERSEVELEGEDPGKIENYTKWSESELVTKGFGQGLNVNLFQMAAAYSALANGGLLMQPYIVDEEILPDGRRIKTEPQTIRRVIDPETSQTITEMLVNSVKVGAAKPAQVKGYFIAGKTGTSQTYLRGRALNEVGTTRASFGGYAPASDPKFVLLVKIDRPRVSEWGAAVAAPIFQKVSEELLTNYFAIPPNTAEE
ncbi:MAG: penicillin-binding protein 2 [Candidatus Peribacteraceae bacterium]|nr:penicillin-binding protein 2 [Candidatus Peribacteraceae bacterium]